MNKQKKLKPLIGTLLTFIVIIGGLSVFKGTDYVFAKYHYLNGYSNQKSLNIRGAIEDYSKVIKYDNSFVTAYISRGSAYLDLKEYDRSIKDYNKAIELTPEDAQIYAYRGRAYYEIEEFDNALRDYDKALTLDNKFAYAYYNRGLLFYSVKFDFKKGCDDLNIALKLGYNQAEELLRNGHCKK
jgi:tetratricopeptide (TPR) repeat protein